MLTEIHFLLTYKCNFECDHCFLYCSPYSSGTFTIQGVEDVLQQAKQIDTIDTIYFEGGEPSFFYTLLLESIRRAAQKGFEVGIVSNAYAALAEEDAELWVKPMIEAGLSVLSVSDDEFHYGELTETPPSLARAAAEKFKLESFPICIDPPKIIEESSPGGEKGKTVVGGGAKFRGRAADKLTEGLPTHPWKEYTECPDEDLVTPSRVHVDPFGNVHICQGISIGNFWEKPLSEIFATYQPESHPICGPLLRGGPASLIKELGVDPDEGYVDACHACYSARREVIYLFPNYLTPRQVYGVDGSSI